MPESNTKISAAKVLDQSAEDGAKDTLKDSLTMRICLGWKRMFLSRQMINLLGNPAHLNFWYDGFDGNLLILPAGNGDVDAYEIPKYFWKSTKQSREEARIAFLTALQYRIGWEVGSRYLFEGSIMVSGDMPTAVFNLANGNLMRRTL